MVVCPICQKKFDKDKEENVFENRRYYHVKCYEIKEKNDQYIQDIHNYCQRMYGSFYNKWGITKAIQDYIKEGKTPLEIYQTIVYHLKDASQEEIERSNGGIAFVGWVYPEAMKYYRDKLEREKRKKEIENMDLSVKEKTYHIHPTPIVKPKRLKLFELK